MIPSAALNLSGNARERATHLINGSKDVTDQEVQVERKALHFVKCENCTFVVKGTLIKLTVEECKNVTIKVEDKILTGTVDLFKSANVSLGFDRSVSMFLLENNQSIDLQLPDPEYFGYMIWAGDDDLKLRLGDDLHVLSYSDLRSRNPDLQPGRDQFKTTVVDGSLKTEAVLRLGGGFPLSRAEQAEFKQSERQKLATLRGEQQDEDETEV
ncbi:hypothetical protein B0O80DRAFT_526917 [Mortierella sp. GBAus27b]|nr:hypothetical protein B0O80DRAFT_526917 [Mortierella sp. GBAus27b]